MKQIASIILAAGRGTRMKSQKAKPLQTVGGKTLVTHAINQLQNLEIDKRICVIGFQSEKVKKVIGKGAQTIVQEPQLGTGHAVLVALPLISANYSTILVMNADDAVFYQTSTLKNIIKEHLESRVKMTIVTSIQEKTNVSGRVIRDKSDQIIDIKANSKMSSEELTQNHEVVCGIYLFDRSWVEKFLPKTQRVSNGEYLLTDLIYVAIRQNTLKGIKLSDSNQWRSINTLEELISARRLWKELH